MGQLESRSPGLIRRAAHVVFLLLMGLAGYAAVVAIADALLPPPHVFQVTPKLHHLAEHRGDYDLLFCGSSRVLRHFMAQEFDQDLAAAGHRVRSFNFGIDAMPPPESFYVLREALALRPRVRWVLIELWDIRTVAAESSLEQRRFIQWHDLRHTSLVLQRLFADSSVDLGEKFRRTGIHLRAAFTRYSQFGRGSEMIGNGMQFDARKRRKLAQYQEPTPWLDRAGFHPGPSEPFPGPKRAEFEEAVRTIRQSFPTSLVPPTLRAEAAALAREVRAIGAEPIFVAMPTVQGNENFSDLRPQGIDASLLSLVSPQRFPELYDSQRHNDVWHLTEQGARDLTRDLAREFRSLIEDRAP